MSYYQFNRQKILQKAKERYSKKKAAEDYLQNKEAIKEKVRERYNNLSQKEKDKIGEYQKKKYQELVQYKKEALKINNFLFFLSIRKMNEKTLKFENIRINKKEFHKSKQPEDLASVNVDKIVISSKFKHSDESFKYFVGYKKDEIVRPLCIILPQMKGYIKYFENGSKNMSFFIKDDDVLYKYNEIWDNIKEKLNINFHSEPIDDKKYI